MQHGGRVAVAAEGPLFALSNCGRGVHSRRSGLNENNESVMKLRELIRDVKFAMLTTEESDGSLRSRPMVVQESEFDGDLWFFTGASSPKVAEIQQHQRVNVALADPDKQRYISVSGTAQLVRDRAKAAELWKPAYKAWFPEGLDDPDLALLKVTVEKAEYWDSPSGAVVHLIGFVKAIATGERMKHPGDHDKIELR